MSLYTGARLNELCQLRVSDVNKVGEIWCLDINEKDGKQLKNVSSTRQIPIHPVRTYPSTALDRAEEDGYIFDPSERAVIERAA